MALKPRNNWLVVKPEAEQVDSTEGGLVLPEVTRTHSQSGVVVSVGPGKADKKGKQKPLAVSAGDRVLFHRHSGHPFDDGSDKFLLMEAGEILAVI